MFGYLRRIKIKLVSTVTVGRNNNTPHVYFTVYRKDCSLSCEW